MITLLDLAEHQIIGFNHATKGYDILSLVQAMGLTKSEWLLLRKIDLISSSNKIEIDKLFKVKVNETNLFRNNLNKGQ